MTAELLVANLQSYTITTKRRILIALVKMFDTVSLDVIRV